MWKVEEKPTNPVQYTDDIIHGFKGVNKDLSCTPMGSRFEYSIGHWHEVILSEGETIKACKRGFHFCKELKDVFSYYSLEDEGENRFFRVEGTGLFHEEDNKIAVSKIRLVEELDRSAIFRELNRPILDYLYELQQTDKEILIGGSIALIMTGKLPIRQFKDVDLVLPHYKINDNFSTEGIFDDQESEDGYLPNEVQHSLRPCEGTNLYSLYVKANVKTDVFINRSAKPIMIEYDNRKFRVISPKTILEAKARYALDKGNSAKKHQKDLITIWSKDLGYEGREILLPIWGQLGYSARQALLTKLLGSTKGPFLELLLNELTDKNEIKKLVTLLLNRLD